MALVILSAGSVTRSKMRTVSIKSFLCLVLSSMMLVLAGGFALGYGLSGDGRGVMPPFASADPVADEDALARLLQVDLTLMSEARAAPLPEPAVAPMPVDIEGDVPLARAVAPAVADSAEGVLTENRHLIDRFGELAGRMIQLEAEAMHLADRIGAIQEFESRINADELDDESKGRIARTPPGAPSGGPLLRSIDEGSRSLEAAPVQADRLDDELSRMEGDIERLAEVLAGLDRIATGYNLAHLSFPGRHPVPETPATSGFGNRLDPFTKRRAFHSGVDYPAPPGTPIHASAGGRVIFAGSRPQYGRTVEIAHGAGLVTRYAHASELLVTEGQVVMPSEPIALIGSTGRSTGPHLHFEILRDGRFVDPSTYLARF
jgi:murein DD-endopeptidase MepM/ murein hydrolase activator NlpD